MKPYNNLESKTPKDYEKYQIITTQITIYIKSIFLQMDVAQVLKFITSRYV